MKNALFALFVIACATPILAQDSSISQNVLSSVGLDDLQPMSEAEGNQVRGKFIGDGGAIGTSLIFFQLLTPDSYNFVNSNMTSTFIGNSQFSRISSPTSKNLAEAHLVGFGPPVTLDIGVWLGSVIGSMGGKGMMKVGF